MPHLLPKPKPQTSAATSPNSGTTPNPALRFIPNHGQWPAPVRYLGRFAGTLLRAEADGRIVLQRESVEAGQARGVALALQVEGAHQGVPEGEEPLAGRFNFMRGAGEPALAVPGFGALVYRSVVDGVDLRLRQGEHGFEYDLILSPEAELASLAMRCLGADRLALDAQGALVATTALGDFIQPPPRTFVLARDGSMQPLASRFRLLGDDRYGFAVDGWDGTSKLVIDPGLLWGSYLGGADDDVAVDVVRAASGEVYVLGHTSSASSFPTTFGSFQPFYAGGLNDVYLARFDPTGGSLVQVWCTFFGGNRDDQALDLCLRRDGTLDFSGTTTSTDLPVTAGAFQTTFQGGAPDGFVARLSGNGTSCLYCTYLGSSETAGGEPPDGLAEAPGGRTVVVGLTYSASFPPATANAYQPAYGGGVRDGYVVILDPAQQGANQLHYATFFGGNGYDWATAVATDAAGTITFGGAIFGSILMHTASSGARGSDDCFVARLDPTQPPGRQLDFCHVFGSNHVDSVQDLVLDRFGRPIVVGDAYGDGMPVTAGAMQAGKNSPWGEPDAFAMCLDTNGNSIVYCTYIGGGGHDYARGVAVDSAGMTTIAGITSGGFYGTTGNAYPSFGGGTHDAFLVRIDHVGRRLHYATYYGGNGDDQASGVALDGYGRAVIVGTTSSTNLPVSGSFQRTYQGGPRDAFVAAIDMLPTGVTRYCVDSPACGRPVAQHVTAKPAAGQTFGLISVGGPERSFGTLMIGVQPVNMQFLCITLCTLPVVTIGGLRSDPFGYSDLLIPVPLGIAGTVYSQWVWLNTPTCGGACTLSASDGLAITFC